MAASHPRTCRDACPTTTAPSLFGVLGTRASTSGSCATSTYRSAGGGDLRNLYARLGAVYREHFDGWAMGVLLESHSLARAIAPQMRTALSLRSGDRRTYLMTTGDEAADA